MSRYYMLTIPLALFSPPSSLPDGLVWLKGQPERGESGYEHWQLICCTRKKCRASAVKRLFCPEAHVELTRSAAADEYVWKDDTCIDPAQRFELGKKPLSRNQEKDWEAIWESSKKGRLDEIPADVRVRSYKTIRQIEKDHMVPQGMVRTVHVFWGSTGMGKSRRAWYEASMLAYPKSPTSIYWDGYAGHAHVVIDEFRGGINISHMLRWLDRYPVCVECKFGACVLNANTIWITSNIHPRDWYPDLDPATIDALLRRLNIVEFTEEWLPPADPDDPDNNDEFWDQIYNEAANLPYPSPAETVETIVLLSDDE